MMRYTKLWIILVTMLFVLTVAAFGSGAFAATFEGTWDVNANGFQGKLTIHQNGSSFDGSILDDAIRNGVIYANNTISFSRPSCNQQYTGIYFKDEYGKQVIKGIFTQGSKVYEWTATGPVSATVTDMAAQDIFNNNNIAAVQNGPSHPTRFTVNRPYIVTLISNYHYFNHGALPGMIALVHQDGTVYGPWRASGRPGQGNVPNAYWEATPNEEIKPGAYTVVDSDPKTWSCNAQSGNCGFTVVKGYPASSATGQPAANSDLTGAWDLNANGFIGKLTIDTLGPKGTIFDEAIANVVIHPDNTITFTRPSCNQDYQGTYSMDGNGNMVLKGTFTWEGGTYNWTATKSKSASGTVVSEDSVKNVMNNSDLTLDKSIYAPGEVMVARFRASAAWPGNAWIGIIPSNIPHGSEAVNDQNDIVFLYLNGRAEGTMTFKAPGPGQWDLRMNDNDAGGKEAASVSFTVVNNGGGQGTSSGGSQVNSSVNSRWYIPSDQKYLSSGTASINGNTVNLAISGNQTAWYHAANETTLAGDFEITASINMTRYPAEYGKNRRAMFCLMSDEQNAKDSQQVYIGMYQKTVGIASNNGGFSYGTDMMIGGGWGRYNSKPLAADPVGLFKITRKNGEIATYFYDNGNWAKLSAWSGGFKDRVRVYFVIETLWDTSTPADMSATFNYMTQSMPTQGQSSQTTIDVTRVPETQPSYGSTGSEGKNGANVALNKKAEQSNTGYNGLAQYAVDGNTDGNFGNKSCSHTGNDAQAWWQVDLDGIYSIRNIVIWNRTDSNPERLGKFYVLVSDTPFSSPNLNETLKQAGVSNYYIEKVDKSVNVSVNRTGRFVRVQLTGTDYLHMAEVQVFGQGQANGLLNHTTMNNSNLTLDKSIYTPGEVMVVRFRASAAWPGNAWIGIIPSNTPHGSEAVNDQNDVAFLYLDGRAEGTMTFKAPGPGQWDLRMNDMDVNGKEVASVSFVVQ